MAPTLPPLPFEKLLQLLQNYDRSHDGTIGSEEVSKLIQALDEKNFWNEARLQSLMEGFGLSNKRLKLESFARILYDGPEAAVYEVVRDDLRKLMTSPDWDDGSYAPILIRLAWHSSGTYCPVAGNGGSNGATMRYDKEAKDPENKYLENARSLLEPIKVKHSWISYADLWILASYVALETTCGPRIKFTGGRMDAAEEKAVTPGRLPEAEHGLAAGMEVDEDGRLKGWENVAAHVRQVFGRMGFKDREAVALLCGGHVYGRCHPQETASGYAGAWVENPTMFSNEYAADMVGDKWIAVTHDTVMPDGGQVPEEVRPAVGRRQYIDLSKYEGEDSEAEQEAAVASDVKDYPPGRYRCLSQWVNCREEADVSSPIVGRFLENQELSIVTVKIIGTEIRGLAEHGGWVSIVNSSGKRLWERKPGDLASSLRPGRYRARSQSGAKVFSEAVVAGPSFGTLQVGDEFDVDKIVFVPAVEGSKEAIMGRLSRQPGYVVIHGDDGLQCEKIVEGYNEKPRKPLKGQTGHQMMLVSDMVLLWDAEFRQHLEVFAEDEELLKKEFGEAFKKLTELGCPWSKDGCPAVL